MPHLHSVDTNSCDTISILYNCKLVCPWERVSEIWKPDAPEKQATWYSQAGLIKSKQQTQTENDTKIIKLKQERKSK